MEKQWMTVGRLEAFSDGVFAIAITLLVLEIRLPIAEWGSDAELRDALLRLWPSYLAYLISFLLIGMVWMNHHRMFRHIRRSDGMLLGLNILLLMSVSFIPFPTHVLAEAVHAHAGQRTASVLYGLVLVIGGVFYNALWWYASTNHRLLDDSITPSEARALRLAWGMGPVLYAVATVIGAFSWQAAMVFYVLLLVFYFFDLRPRREGGTVQVG